MTALASLLVNKRKLPALLRHDVPPLRLAGTTVEPLVATRSRLWGVLHSDVGKKILHRGQAVAILNVHQNTRLVIRTNEEEHKAFWIPRRPTDRTQFNIERMWRSRRSHTLRAPVGFVTTVAGQQYFFHVSSFAKGEAPPVLEGRVRFDIGPAIAVGKKAQALNVQYLHKAGEIVLAGGAQ